VILFFFPSWFSFSPLLLLHQSAPYALPSSMALTIFLFSNPPFPQTLKKGSMQLGLGEFFS
jgi:hypothetical protein